MRGKTPEMTLADYLVAALAAAGVRRIYGVPGLAVLPLLDALSRQDRVRWVLMAHENAAALAASAESKLTGQLGVCATTSGPGALQALCGVVDANLDRTPLLLLSGLVPRANLGHWGFQDVDQAALYRLVLPASTACVTAGQTAALLRAQVAMARQRGAATHLALPVDLLGETLPEDDDLFDAGALGQTRTTPAPIPDVAGAAAALAAARRPVIVVGRRAHGAGAEILRLAERLDAPVVAALDGKGVVDESHPYYLGVYGIFGFPGTAATARVIAEGDLILAFGVDYVKPFITDGRHVQRRALVQVQPAEAFLAREYDTSCELAGPVPALAAALSGAIPARTPGTTLAALSAERLATMADILERLHVTEGPGTGLANPLDFLLQLNHRLGPQHMLAVDTGSHTIWAALFLRLKAGQKMLVSASLGTMGFALPAAIAMQLAEPERRAVAIMGDGCFAMTGLELPTAVALGLPIVVVVVNNGTLQNVSAQQAEPFGVAMPRLDYVALARACGADGAVVDAATDLDAVLDAAFAPRHAPFLIDLRCDPALLAPLSKWEAAGYSAAATAS
jgi:pyruvate oxidase